MISQTKLRCLKAALTAGLSSRMAAAEAGCAFDTARRYRRALEAAGLVDPKPVRKVKDGRMVRVERIGSHMATGPRSHGGDAKRIQLLRAV